MKRSIALAAAVLLVSQLGVSVADATTGAPDGGQAVTGNPDPSFTRPAQLKRDSRHICLTVLQDWSDLDVLRNDRGYDLRLTDFGTPANGEARWKDGKLEYRDPNGNGTYWRYYEVHDGHGDIYASFWQVTADLDC